MRTARFGVSLAVALGMSLSAGAVQAETLTETLIRAYQTSPLLESSRASLRNFDENVPLQRSARRPNVSASSTGSLSASDDDDWEIENSFSATLQASLLIYDHGETAAAVESARAIVSAQRWFLISDEQDVLLDAVTAFMDVRRDLESVNVARNNVEVLSEQVRATQDRFDLGEVTRTDVSLAEARLAAAQANEAAVLGSLAISRENYLAAVGEPAGNLLPPPSLPDLPASLSEAEAIAMREQPQLNAARFNQISSEFDLTRARAARGPTVSLGADVTYTDTPGVGGATGRSRETSAGLSITGNLPIYQGGQLSALVRQAEASLAQSQFDVQNTARGVRQNLGSAWSNLAVARATIAANQQEVRAATVAFEGVREEATLGARTTLDVLDLEQDLRDAEFQLASSLRDEYVAAYQLLSAMGLLTVKHLNLGIPTYDPDVNFNRVQSGPYSTVEGTILDKLRDRYSR
ncbi:MAG: TolC family outer membrane protein [Pseudomonadota bacterium]